MATVVRDAAQFFAEHEAAMSAYSTVANRYGQSIEANLIPDGPFTGAAVIRHAISHAVIAVIWADGRLLDAADLRSSRPS